MIKNMFIFVLCVTWTIHLVFGFSFDVSHFRDLHLGAAKYMAESGLTITAPVIPGFDLAENPVPQEPAIWQFLVAACLRFFSPSLAWGNLVSLVLFTSAYFPFYQMVKTNYTRDVAWLSALCLSTQPLIFLWGGTASTDSYAIAISIWWLYFVTLSFRNPSSFRIAASILLAGLAATTKLPFFFSVAVAAGLLLLPLNREKARMLVILGSCGAASAAAFWLWNYHCDNHLDALVFPKKELRPSLNPAMYGWYFGSWADRLAVNLWAQGGYRAMNLLFGSYVLIVAMLIGMFSDRFGFATRWLAGFLAALAIFTNLILVHQHYYLMLSPSVAILVALGVHKVASGMLQGGAFPGPKSESRQTLMLLSIIGMMIFGLIQGLVASRVWMIADRYPIDMADRIREWVSKDEKILIAGGGWGGEMLIRSDRRGYSLARTELLESDEFIQKASELGYTKLVLLSESPLVSAARKTNPGGSTYQRATWKDFQMPPAIEWPILLESEDIVIREIPRNALMDGARRVRSQDPLRE